MKDWRGTSVEVSSHVIYPVRHSSNQWMVAGVVTEVISKIEDRWNFEQRKRVPTEVGHVKLRRLRTNDRGYGVPEPTDREYAVQLANLTVIGPQRTPHEYHVLLFKDDSPMAKEVRMLSGWAITRYEESHSPWEYRWVPIPKQESAEQLYVTMPIDREILDDPEMKGDAAKFLGDAVSRQVKSMIESWPESREVPVMGFPEPEDEPA